MNGWRTMALRLHPWFSIESEAMLQESQRSNSGGLNIEGNRSASKWSRQDQILRVLWAMVWPLFRFSPRPMWAWRRMLLRIFGSSVGKGAHIHPTARIQFPWHIVFGEYCAVGDWAIIYALGNIEIGPRATVSQYAHLCAGSHDYNSADMRLLKTPITIGEQSWICADAFIGPGANIGAGAVVAARAVAVADVPSGQVVAGNPARFIKDRYPVK